MESEPGNLDVGVGGSANHTKRIVIINNAMARFHPLSLSLQQDFGVSG